MKKSLSILVPFDLFIDLKERGLPLTVLEPILAEKIEQDIHPQPKGMTIPATIKVDPETHYAFKLASLESNMTIRDISYNILAKPSKEGLNHV